MDGVVVRVDPRMTNQQARLVRPYPPLIRWKTQRTDRVLTITGMQDFGLKAPEFSLFDIVKRMSGTFLKF